MFSGIYININDDLVVLYLQRTTNQRKLSQHDSEKHLFEADELKDSRPTQIIFEL